MAPTENVPPVPDDEALYQQFAELTQSGDQAALDEFARTHGLQLFQADSSYQSCSIHDTQPDATVVARNPVPQYQLVCDGVLYSTTTYYELYRQDFSKESK